MSIVQYDTVNKTVYRRSSVHKHSTYKLPEIQRNLFVCPAVCETVKDNSDRRCTIMTEIEVGIMKHFERRENDKHCTYQLFSSMLGVKPLEPTSFVCKEVPVIHLLTYSMVKSPS